MREKRHLPRSERPNEGDLIQIDASRHDWFMNGQEIALHEAIDDATHKIVGLYFCANECLLGYYQLLTQVMCSTGGLPSAIYSDRDSYRFSFYRRKQMRFTASLQQANLRRTERELQRSHSFLCRPMKTLQGRLPYIFRYLGINTIDKANAFLKEFIIHFNTRFSVKAQEETVNWHSPRGKANKGRRLIKPVRKLQFRNRLP